MFTVHSQVKAYLCEVYLVDNSKGSRIPDEQWRNIGNTYLCTCCELTQAVVEGHIHSLDNDREYLRERTPQLCSHLNNDIKKNTGHSQG